MWRRRKIESDTVAWLFAVLSCCVFQSAVAAPTLSLGAVNASPGDSVEIPVTFTNDGTAAAIQFDVQYDSALVTSDGPVAGASLNTHGLASNIISPGVRRVVITPPADNALLDAGELVRLPFTVQPNTGSTSRLISLSGVVISNATAGNVTPGAVGGGLIGDPANTTADQDGDGMPDSWEITYGLDPFNAADALADANGNGVTNLQEYQQGTDPTQQGQSIPSRIYLSNHASSSTGDTSRIVAIDPVTGAQIASIAMVDDPEGLVSHPDGSTVYAAVGTDLSVVDVQSNTEVNHLLAVAGTDSAVGLLEDIAIAPDGHKLYLAYRKLPTATLEVKVFDTTIPTNPTVSATIDDSAFDGCYGPLGLAVRPDGGAVYLACRPTTAGDPDRFYTINTATNAVTQTATFMRDASNYAFINAIAVNPGGTKVYLSRTDSDGSTVEVFDGTTGSNVASIALPDTALPRRGAVSPDGTRLYVVDQRLGTHVIDTSNNTLLVTMSNTNSRGFDIAASPDGSHLYTSLLFSVFTLDTSTNSWSSTLSGDFGHAYQITVTPGH